MSRGFAMTGRFATDFGIEIEPHFAKAFAANIKDRSGAATAVYTGDIHELVDDERRLAAHLERLDLGEPGTLDVLIGGPPCQGFSRNGVRRYGLDGVRFYDAPINHLYKAFLQVLAETMPRVVVIENVREFLNAAGGKFTEELFARLDELGYEAQARIVCAADYGVPQLRHRMIVIGYRKPIKIRFPAPEFAAPSQQADLFARAYHTVRDAIGDLPPVVYGDRKTPLPYISATTSPLAEILRSNTGVVSNHFARHLSRLNLERIRAVGVGRMRDVDPALQTKAFYGSAYGRLAWDSPSLTITTWVYHVGSGRFAHPEEDRAITMREAARLQSFDDDFLFPPLINPVSRMIGNAVPPLLAKALAVEIARGLDALALRAGQRLNSEPSSPLSLGA